MYPEVISFSTVPNKIPKNAPNADLKATSERLPFISSPNNAPTNGPRITPVAPKKNPAINPIAAPHVPAFEPPVNLVENTENKLSSTVTASTTNSITHMNSFENGCFDH